MQMGHQHHIDVVRVDSRGGQIVDGMAHCIAEHVGGFSHAGVNQDQLVTGVDHCRVQIHRDMIFGQPMLFFQARHFGRVSIGKDAFIAVVNITVPNRCAFQLADFEPIPPCVLRVEQLGCHGVLPV